MKVTLRKARRDKELSQAEMAKLLNVHPNTYINWEKTPGKISIAVQTQICAILYVRPDEIDWMV